MRKLLLLTLILAISLTLYANTIVYTLPNGMRVALRQTSSNSVGLYCFVRTGSIHEEEYLGSGISHYLEHIVSSGSTSKRTEAEYLEMEASIGALVNAYTTYDHSCYHMQVDIEHVDTALGMLSEQLMYCIFEENEINRELEVILKEMVYRESTPFARVYQKFLETAYSNSYQRFPVIGYPEYFVKLTREDLIKYYNRRFTPHNMVFVAVGNFDIDEMYAKIANAFVEFVRPPSVEIFLPTQPVPVSTYTVMEESDIELASVLISRPIPSDNPADYFALTMASEILFGKRTSPLFKYFVEDTMLVNYIYAHASYSPFNNSMLFTSFEVNEIENIEKVIKLLNEKYLEFTKPKKINQKMLDDVIKKYETNFFMQDYDIDEIASEIGESMLNYNIPNFEEITINELKKVTIADVQRVIAEHFLGNQVIFYALPTGKKSYFENSSDANIVKTDFQRITLNDRVNLLYRQNTEKPVVRLAVQIPSSTHHETANDYGTLEFMFDILFTGSKKYPPMQLSDWMEDRSISYQTNISRSGSNFTFTCMANDLDGLVERIIDCLTNPLFAESEIDLMKTKYYAWYMRQLSMPNYAHENFINKNQFLNPRAFLTNLEEYSILSKLTRNDLSNAFQKYITADNILILIDGDISETKAGKVANYIATKIPNKAIAMDLIPSQLNIAGNLFENPYPFEQTNITITAVAPDISDRRESIIMTVIDNYLSGTAGRLHQAVRGENDLAYMAHSRYRVNLYESTMNITSQTSIDKKDELIQVLENVITKLKTELITQKDIHDAVNSDYRMWKNLSQEPYFIYSILYYESLGIGYDFLDTMLPEKLSVTPEEVMEIAKKYFEVYNIYVSFPEGDE